MTDYVVPWMILPYARGAKNRTFFPPLDFLFPLTFVTEDEMRNMLTGIGTRFDYHVCKSLCEIR